MKLFSIFVISLLLIPVASIFAAKYSYNGTAGPAKWGDLGYKKCNTGLNQSPIDLYLEDFETPERPEDPKFSDAHYVEIINNGHTIQISKNLRTSEFKFNNSEYVLLQFHFHTPSEHRINEKHFDVEAHFVFAYKDDPDEKPKSVIGVFYNISEKPSEFLKPIIDNIPKKPNDKTTIREIKLSSVLKDINDMKDNTFRYYGSLTTPPCDEGVIWWVVGKDLPISITQYLKLRGTMGFNSRFTLPRNANTFVTAKQHDEL